MSRKLMIAVGAYTEYWKYKRYSRIDQHLARHFVNYGACLSIPPPPFYAVKQLPLSEIQ